MPIQNLDPNLEPTQVLHMLENQKLFFTLIHSSASLHCLLFIVSVKGVIIFNILDRILKFSGKGTGTLYLGEVDRNRHIRPDPDTQPCKKLPIRT
jgi:hypothetical protein